MTKEQALTIIADPYADQDQLDEAKFMLEHYDIIASKRKEIADRQAMQPPGKPMIAVAPMRGAAPSWRYDADETTTIASAAEAIDMRPAPIQRNQQGQRVMPKAQPEQVGIIPPAKGTAEPLTPIELVPAEPKGRLVPKGPSITWDELDKLKLKPKSKLEYITPEQFEQEMNDSNKPKAAKGAAKKSNLEFITPEQFEREVQRQALKDSGVEPKATLMEPTQEAVMAFTQNVLEQALKKGESAPLATQILKAIKRVQPELAEDPNTLLTIRRFIESPSSYAESPGTLFGLGKQAVSGAMGLGEGLASAGVGALQMVDDLMSGLTGTEPTEFLQEWQDTIKRHGARRGPGVEVTQEIGRMAPLMAAPFTAAPVTATGLASYASARDKGREPAVTSALIDTALMGVGKWIDPIKGSLPKNVKNLIESISRTSGTSTRKIAPVAEKNLLDAAMMSPEIAEQTLKKAKNVKGGLQYLQERAGEQANRISKFNPYATDERVLHNRGGYPVVDSKQAHKFLHDDFNKVLKRYADNYTNGNVDEALRVINDKMLHVPLGENARGTAFSPKMTFKDLKDIYVKSATESRIDYYTPLSKHFDEGVIKPSGDIYVSGSGDLSTMSAVKNSQPSKVTPEKAFDPLKVGNVYGIPYSPAGLKTAPLRIFRALWTDMRMPADEKAAKRVWDLITSKGYSIEDLNRMNEESLRNLIGKAIKMVPVARQPLSVDINSSL